MGGSKKEKKGTEYFRGVSFVASHPRIDHLSISRGAPCIVVMGRSNSGKSSLISALCDHKNLARISKTAGKTRLLNQFRLPPGNLGEREAFLVDTPGYGFTVTSREDEREMALVLKSLFVNETPMDLLLLVLDARRKLNEQEATLLDSTAKKGVDILIARTKWDTMNAKERSAAKRLWKEEGIDAYCIPVSSTRKEGLDRLLFAIREIVQNRH